MEVIEIAIYGRPAGHCPARPVCSYIEGSNFIASGIIYIITYTLI